MPGGIGGAIAEAIMQGPEGARYASMSIMGINPVDSSSVGFLPEHTFQYWPETISDSLDVGWNFKDIPGASSALAQWSSNNGRTITFEVQLSRFMKPVEDRTLWDNVLDPFSLNKPSNRFNEPDNVDVKAEIRYLRAFRYPSFKDVDSYTTSYPPPIAMLCIPGIGLDTVTGGDVIFSIMTGCDVTYNLLFPDGTPRRATVSLTFKQILQNPITNKIEQEGFKEGYTWDNGWVKGREKYISQGGGRGKNGF